MPRDDKRRKPGILEQVRRIERGLPGIPKYGILAQADRIMRGLPGLPKRRGILAQVQRATEPDSFEWFSPIPDDKAITTVNMPPWLRRKSPRKPAPESLLVRRARERHWELEGAMATAQSSAATLEGLAEAITGNKADCNLLEFPGESRTLSEGDSVNIMPLLRKAAGEPKVLERGQFLGDFLVTAYNIAREADHPREPATKAAGLDRPYSAAFLKDVKMQGSGIDRDGRLIQLKWQRKKGGKKAEIVGYVYVDSIRTASGKTIVPDVSIAVDPEVIPLGTWVFVEDVGWRRADDTGGKIKGQHVDVFVGVSRGEALRLGRRRLKVWRSR